MPRMVSKKAGEQEDKEKDTLRFVNNQMIDSLHNLFAPSCCGKEGATLSSISYQGAEGEKGVIAICDGVESVPSAALPSSRRRPGTGGEREALHPRDERGGGGSGGQRPPQPDA